MRPALRHRAPAGRWRSRSRRAAVQAAAPRKAARARVLSLRLPCACRSACASPCWHGARPPRRAAGRRSCASGARSSPEFPRAMLVRPGVEVVDVVLNIATVAAEDRALAVAAQALQQPARHRSEEHTSELQSLMRISYAVFCLKKK